jgi:diaminopimelate decarboxylase/aspartate kinase
LPTYQAGLEKNIYLTIDNLYILQSWPTIFSGKEILIRIDPGISKGHHKYVLTSGSNSKFGIILDDLPEVIKIANEYDIKIIGLHAHVGSGIMDFKSWSNLLDILAKELAAFKDCRIIDLGGGLGVPEKLSDPELDMDALNKSLLTKKIGKVELWMEPGRYLVSGAGILLSKITQLKSKGDMTFIGSDIGMHTLIRPALYAAYHEVFNLSRFDEEKKVLANIVGPICESGDIIARMRKFPDSSPGDYIIVTNAGAYGRVMSSNYTMKGLPREKILWI